MHPSKYANISAQVGDEVSRQDARWGEQNHADGTGGHLWRALSDDVRMSCDRAFEDGLGTWRHILREEVYEAFAEDDPAALRNELIQVAAVAMQWVAAIDRRAQAFVDEQFGSGNGGT